VEGLASKEVLTNEVKGRILLEADLVDIAPTDRFEGALCGHGPRDFLPEARSVIVFGMKLVDTVVEYDKYYPSMIPEASRSMSLVRSLYYEMGHCVQDRLLNYLAYKIARRLEKMGHRPLPMPATQPVDELRLSSFFGIFSHRHTATRAGLGEFGFNGLVITPEFGPRVRFNSVITEAEFEYDPPISKKICLIKNCNRCLESCILGAITLRDDVDVNSIFIDPPSKTDTGLCRPTLFRSWTAPEPNAGCKFYGTCMRVCPIR